METRKESFYFSYNTIAQEISVKLSPIVSEKTTLDVGRLEIIFLLQTCAWKGRASVI